MDVRVGLSAKELMLLNCGVGEDSWESLGLQGNPTSPSYNQSILKEINPEYSLEGLKLKLKLQYFGHLMQRTDSLEKILMLGKIEGRRRREWQDEMVGCHHWLDGHEFKEALRVGNEGKPGVLQSMGSQSLTWLSNWTELNLMYFACHKSGNFLSFYGYYHPHPMCKDIWFNLILKMTIKWYTSLIRSKLKNIP